MEVFIHTVMRGDQLLAQEVFSERPTFKLPTNTRSTNETITVANINGGDHEMLAMWIAVG